MLITLPNADFSGTGLGKVTRLVNGMPQTGLVGLWLFDGGAVGASISSVADQSGAENDAALRSGWASGIKRSYGLEVASNQGTALQTAIPINPSGRQMTVFVACSNTLPGSESGVFNTFVGSTTNYGMALPENNHSNSPSLVLNFSGGTTPKWQVYNSSAAMLGGANLLAGGAPQPGFSEPTVAALDIDGVNSIVKLHVLGAAMASVSDPDIGVYYDGSTSRGALEIGAWPNGTARSAAASIAQIYAVAAYAKTFTDSDAQSHMAFMKKIAEARGVTGF